MRPLSDKTIEANINVYESLLGFTVEDVYVTCSRISLSYSEKKILNSTQTFIDQAILHLCIGLSEEKTDEFLMNRMNWPP
ncbi:LOW QUALITY PROTEIN: hypothetical protein HID58_085769 [Brassica napus]|uniref:Uncharacterized protein n=1 Tax=Brassica napus TaxID=3708 RepID=A0ABQ7XNR1_BRANA|nr:LOW QUALITY PROTEIN: hypothetical protein HID58_085769 [Brassica napus]